MDKNFNDTSVLGPETKLKTYGHCIDDNIWCILQEFPVDDVASCLQYASLYQEHCLYQTIMQSFFDNIPQETEDGNESLDESLDESSWYISDDDDNTMLMASGVLIYRSSWYFEIDVILSLKNNSIKALPILLNLLEVREIEYFVKDDYAFWNFSPRMSFLEFFKGRSEEVQKMISFRGCLQTLDGLPLSIENISLSIYVDDHNVAIDPGFSRIKPNTDLTLDEILLSFENLSPSLSADDQHVVKDPGYSRINPDTLNIYLKAGVDISNLPNVSSLDCFSLIVSCVEESHILWMTQLVKEFLSQVKYLIFLDCHLELESSKNMLKSIAEAGFEIKCGILWSSSSLDPDMRKVLDDLARILWPLNVPQRYLRFFQLFSYDYDIINNISKIAMIHML